MSRARRKRRYPFKQQLSRKMRRILFMAIALALATGINYYNNHYGANRIPPALDDSSQTFTQAQQQRAVAKIRAARDNTQAQFWVGLNATVIKRLKDDLSGSRHQKFLIRPDAGITLLVSHNIDLAPRVPLSKGDTISLRGRYEWNNRGGVIHWTHHDPKGRKQGGWIRAHGKLFR